MFADNYKALAESNSNFRNVLETGHYSQIVAMSLAPTVDIGKEVHETTDQIFLVASGEGTAMVAGEVRVIGKGDLIFVPAGTEHNIANTGEHALKVLTIYAPPAHPDGTVEAEKPE